MGACDGQTEHVRWHVMPLEEGLIKGRLRFQELLLQSVARHLPGYSLLRSQKPAQGKGEMLEWNVLT